MSLLQTSLKGAVLGGAIGATVSVTYHMMSPGTQTNDDENAPSAEEKNKYRYICANADVNFLITELTVFKRTDEESENAFTVLCDSVDRLLALEHVTNHTKGEDANAGWPVTAHHYNQETLEALAILRTKITKQQQRVTFDMHVEELKQQVQNSLYNIDMNVQHVLNGS